MSDVTVTGGVSHPIVDLGFVQSDTAYNNAQALAQAIDDAFASSTAVVLHAGDGSVPAGSDNYLIVSQSVLGGPPFQATGYGAIVVDNVAPSGSAPGTTLPVAPNAAPDVSIFGGYGGGAA